VALSPGQNTPSFRALCGCTNWNVGFRAARHVPSDGIANARTNASEPKMLRAFVTTYSSFTLKPLTLERPPGGSREE